MIKQAPSLGRILTMVAFTFSCFGIVLFLWISFGGSVPLRAKGYQVHVAFPEATQLAQSAEVRISGVKVGRVRTVEPNAETGLTDTVVEIDARFAPIPSDTRAILRQKTLLGETYVELSPGTAEAGDQGRLADGGKLPQGQVSETVELDEILRTFDPETRRQFSVWFDQQGEAVRGNAEAINDALGNLTPFAEETDKVLAVLRQQGARDPQADPRHRRGVRGADRAPGPAARPDRQLQQGLAGHGPPQRRARRHLPRAAHLPARGSHHHPAPDASSPRTPIR